MRNWQSFLDMMHYPIMILLVAFLLLGIGNLPYNVALAVFLPTNNSVFILIANIFRYFGSFLINNFPLFIVITMVGRRKGSATPIISAVVGYFVFMVVCTFIAPQTYGQEFYNAIFGISVNMSDFSMMNNTFSYPFQMGVVAAIIIVYITRITYRISRKHSVTSLFAFADSDSYCIVLTIITCFFAGFVASYLWPYAIYVINYIMHIIARDITSPTNLFIYGVFDRLMSLTGLSSISHNAFWFNTLGGSWMDSLGNNFLGDVAVWTAQQNALIVSNGAGRLITPYYLLNIFAVPAVAISVWLSYTSTKERRRYLSFLIGVIVVSVLFGTLLPFELFLLVTAPFLLFTHIAITGLLFGVLQNIGIFIGYNYSGSYAYANPGGFIDILPYLNDTYTRGTFYLFLIFGLIIFALYFLITYLYFNYFAFDFVNLGKDEIVDKLIESFGGLGNLRNIQASVEKVTITVINPSVVNLNILIETGIGKFIENKDGYNIYLGSDSIIIRRRILKRLRGEKDDK